MVDNANALGIINARTTMGINIGGFPCNSCHPVPSNNSLLESKKQDDFFQERVPGELNLYPFSGPNCTSFVPCALPLLGYNCSSTNPLSQSYPTN